MHRRRFLLPERGEECCVVLNARKPTVVLTPADPTAGTAVVAGWVATLPGQAVPLVGERGYDDAEPCGC